MILLKIFNNKSFLQIKQENGILKNFGSFELLFDFFIEP